MFAIRNDELESCEPIGDSIVCAKCNEEHLIEYGETVLPDGTKKPSRMLAFYKCGDITYLAGLKGKKINFSGGMYNVHKRN